MHACRGTRSLEWALCQFGLVADDKSILGTVQVSKPGAELINLKDTFTALYLLQSVRFNFLKCPAVFYKSVH